MVKWITSFLEPYTWVLWLIGIIAAVLLPAYAYYMFASHYEQVGFDRAKVQWQAERAAMVHEHQLKEWAWIGKYQKAEYENENLKQQNRRFADAARAADRRLRDAGAKVIADAVRSSPEACAVAASTAIELLGECSERYISVGEAADGHAVDAKRLYESWPEVTE